MQRAETLGKEKIRLDQEFPSARYSLVHTEDKIYGVPSPKGPATPPVYHGKYGFIID